VKVRLKPDTTSELFLEEHEPEGCNRQRQREFEPVRRPCLVGRHAARRRTRVANPMRRVPEIDKRPPVTVSKRATPGQRHVAICPNARQKGVRALWLEFARPITFFGFAFANNLF
jgi:hypothetical protein